MNEADGEDGKGEEWEKIIDMKTYTRAEIKVAPEKSGFEEINIYHHEKNLGLLCSQRNR